ncbi:formin-like protein 5 [Cynara cardunculus var. scolymus]|uniref:formin-like protein 5 n=1 Tax=Cynara cardunculus var. scolymus TaxID=59895 RepID=UPI000D62E18C|nr:formin-like protein 5 [Cynara cardunculus var. scolymus]
MVSFIAFVLLLFPLAASIVSDSHTDAQQLPLANLTNSEGMMGQDPDVKTSLVDCNNIHIPVSVQDTRHIQRWNAAPPIRRRLAQEDIEPIPFTVSKADTGGGGIDNTTIIIVVVSTSTVTFLLATLLFCWYTRTYGGGQNDEKPLLSLSRSASQKSSYSIKDSVDQSFPDLQNTDSSVNSSVSLAFASELPPESLSASRIPPLKPPPGRAESTLKPPPGRTDLSVHPPSANTASAPPRSPAAVPSPSPTPAPAAAPSPPPLRAPSARRPPPPPPPSGGAPPPPPPLKEGPRPPPPPSGGRAPPRPPGGGLKTPRHAFGPGDPDADDSNKAKLKPFFWDKVMATPDQAMVWHQIRAGSFQFNEEMIENLFGYNAADKNKTNNKKSSAAQDPSSHFVQIIDSKKAQNLSILLKALNVTTNEVCDALKEGNELPVELIQTLLKMAPTGEEELKLRLYNGDLSRLGTAERFLKRLVEIPFAFKRLESLLFMCTLQEEEEIIKESFQTLEAACVQLRKSRLFLKLLEAVLKTGNRMNDGTFRGSAQAFKLDTLLKLSDVKGVDGKTTLLHFVVLEIIRAEGVRAAKTAQETKSSSSFKTDDFLEEEAAANSCQGDTDEYYRTLGLQVVSRLSSELEDVKKAAILDAEGLTGTVSKFGQALVKAREFLNTDLKSLEKEDEDEDDDDEDEFSTTLSNFVQNAEKDVMWMLEEEKRIMALVKNTADYFHGQAGKDEGLRLFIIVRDFLIILDKVCKEIKATPLRPPPKTTLTKDVSSSKTTEKKDGSPSRTMETNNYVSSPQTNDVSTPRTQETHETPRTHSLGAENSPHKIWETENPRQEPKGSRHETREAQDLQHETHKAEDMQHEIQETVDKTQEADDSLHEKQQEDEDLEPKTHEDDLRQETLEPDDSQSKMQEDDVSQPKTWESDSLQHEMRKTDSTDDSGPETQVTDDLGPKTQETDNSGTKTLEDDDPLPKTHEQLLSAIAIRRVDSISSNSSSGHD